MMVQTPARIFKSQQRSLVQSEEYRCLSTLIEEGHPSQSRNPFEVLAVFNDETLAKGKRQFYHVEDDMLVIIIPLVGPLEVEDSKRSRSQLLMPEEIKVLSLKKGQSFSVTNRNKGKLANFLQIRLNGTGLGLKKSFGNLWNNVLTPLLNINECHLHFGVFDGRKEAEYRLRNPRNGLFVFVINGAFELENRLLETRDALALWDTDKIELEALSENAILLLLETSMSKKLKK